MNDNKLQIVNVRQLKELYKIKKAEIVNRLRDFRKTWVKNDNKIFAELCFCIATPQSRAEVCNEIINKLEKSDLLFEGSIEEIMPYVRKARFYKNKAKYIVNARNFFSKNGKLKIKENLNIDDILRTRDWLIKSIKGLGYKESSHFLRNIGFGDNLAILDVHILRNLKNFGIIKKLPKSLTKKRYLEIENKFKKFADRIKIPVPHLDLLFWSIETGKIFK